MPNIFKKVFDFDLLFPDIQDNRTQLGRARAVNG